MERPVLLIAALEVDLVSILGGLGIGAASRKPSSLARLAPWGRGKRAGWVLPLLTKRKWRRRYIIGYRRRDRLLV